MADNERELIRGFLAGESPAYNTVDSWITSILSFRSWHHSIRAAKDDIRQEVLVALTENFRNNKYKGLGLKTYVSSVTKFICLKAYDRHPVDSLESRDIPDVGNSELENIVRDEEFSVVREAISRSGERCRKMLAMRFYRELNHNQIAGTLQITSETSRQWLKRCLDKIRKLVKNKVKL
jgi:RNA polymerase sigma factor (sigma-70 family)